MRIAVVGSGATGRRVARQLAHAPDSPELVLVDHDQDTARAAAESLGGATEWQAGAQVPNPCDIVVLATPTEGHVALARAALDIGAHVVSVSDSIGDVRGLLRLDELARDRGATVLVGAGMMPGLTDLLAAHGSRVHAAWGDTRSGDAEIYVRSSDDAGRSFDAEQRLSDEPYASWVPSVDAWDDVAVVAWVDYRDANEEEYLRVTRDGGRTWEPAVRVTEDPADSWAPSVAVRGEAIFLTWFVCIASWTYIFTMPDIYRASTRLYIDTKGSLGEILQGIAVTTDVLEELNVMVKSSLPMLVGSTGRKSTLAVARTSVGLHTRDWG